MPYRRRRSRGRLEKSVSSQEIRLHQVLLCKVFMYVYSQVYKYVLYSIFENSEKNLTASVNQLDKFPIIYNRSWLMLEITMFWQSLTNILFHKSFPPVEFFYKILLRRISGIKCSLIRSLSGEGPFPIFFVNYNL